MMTGKEVVYISDSICKSGVDQSGFTDVFNVLVRKMRKKTIRRSNSQELVPFDDGCFASCWITEYENL